MFLIKKYLDVSCLLLMVDFQMSHAGEYSRLSDLREELVNVYLRYRRDLECDAPLCSERKHQNESTVSDQDKTGNLDDSFSYVSNESCCSPCSCSDSCLRYGNCCPDKLTVDFVISSDYPLGGIFNCVATTVKQNDRQQAKIRMIDKCKIGFSDSQVVKKCTGSLSGNLEDHVFVSHKTTNETYKNIHCARCNYLNETDIVKWLAKIKCRQGNYYFPSEMSEIIAELGQHKNCDIEFVPPQGIAKTACDTAIFTCNETGLVWANETKVLEEGCKAFNSEFRNGSETYRNIFCYLCNVDNIGSSREQNCDLNNNQLTNNIQDLYVRFTALLDFSEPPHMTKADECGENYVFDSYKNVCRKIICPTLTVLNKGSCRSLYQSVNGLIFEAKIQVTTREEEMNEGIKDQLKGYFYDMAKNVSGNDIRLFIEVQSTLNWNLSYTVHILFLDKIDFAEKLMEFDNSAISLPMANSLLAADQTFGMNISVSNKGTKSFSTQLVSPDANTLLHRERIFVSKFYRCKMIELNLTDFEINRNSTGLVFREIGLNLVNNDYIEINNNTIRVCADDFLPSVTRTLVTKETAKSFISILSITCCCLSMTCLAITVSVYSVFPDLKTQPGSNNVFLSISMLLAYMGLFVGGISEITGIWCSLIGLLVHVLWLNSIFWLNVCCFHMFKTFISTKMPVKKKASWLYHVYCLVSSAILVTINIIWSLSSSEGAVSGYGKRASVCYIFYPYMVGYTMTLPVVLIVVSNIVMYMAAIYKIKKDSFSTRTQKNRQHFSVYIKLSTITGVSWLSYIPAFLTRSSVLETVFSVLVACQGVYIMSAFVCNARIVILCRSVFKLRKDYSADDSDAPQENSIERGAPIGMT